MSYQIPEKKEPLKPNRKPLKDKAYLTWLHEVKQPESSCCGKINGIELHHVKNCSSDPKNDHFVIPLCGVECHRLGTTLSAHGTPKLFRETFSVYDQKEYAFNLYQEYLND